VTVTHDTRKRETVVRLTRVLDAPRERVFAAWTEARQLEQWFGPQGVTLHSCETDPRPGGRFRICMRSPQGKDYWVRGVYREIMPPERLVIVCTAHDEKDRPQLEEVISVTLAAEGDGTRLSLHATAGGAGPEAEKRLTAMPTGWNQTVTRLDDLLK
jgi:uncharacterized protein YndB with AHSA1/START domain